MQKEHLHTKTKKGFSSIEVMLAVSIISMAVLAIISSISFGLQSTAAATLKSKGITLARQSFEAVREIRNQSYSSLPTSGTYGLAVSGNQWTLVGTPDVNDIYTRTITITTVSTTTKQVVVTITTSQGTVASMTQYLTDWYRNVAFNANGLLVYGYSSGLTFDDIRYKVFDTTNNVWTTAKTAADVSALTTNRVLKVLDVYSSATRNEKMLISKHYDGLSQYIYAQVYNSTADTWGNVNLLSSWVGTTFLDTENFSGTYLANGDFMVVYSPNNSTTLNYSIWNGTSWAGPYAMQSVAAAPGYIVTKARPSTNEVMVATFSQNRDTQTQYFNGGAYNTLSNWTLHTLHSNRAPLTTKQFIDFDWSPQSTTIGALVFSDSNTDVAMNIKIWTANGSGGGSWTATTVNTANQSSQVGGISVVGRKGTSDFLACNKDANGTPRITCYIASFTPTWSTATNISTATTNTIQKSFDIGAEAASGQYYLALYSDTTTTPKIKKYGSAWDSAPTNATSSLSGVPQSASVIPDPATDDVMFLIADANQTLYSVVWNGTTNAPYTTVPVYKALTNHGTFSSGTSGYKWYGFTWNR